MDERLITYLVVCYVVMFFLLAWFTQWIESNDTDNSECVFIAIFFILAPIAIPVIIIGLVFIGVGKLIHMVGGEFFS